MLTLAKPLQLMGPTVAGYKHLRSVFDCESGRIVYVFAQLDDKGSPIGQEEYVVDGKAAADKLAVCESDAYAWMKAARKLSGSVV